MSDELIKYLTTIIPAVVEAFTEFLNFYFWIYFIPLKQKFEDNKHKIVWLMFSLVAINRLIRSADQIFGNSYLFMPLTILYFAGEIIILLYCFDGKLWKKAMLFFGVKCMEIVAIVCADLFTTFLSKLAPDFFFNTYVNSWILPTLMVSIPMVLLLGILMLLVGRLFKGFSRFKNSQALAGIEFIFLMVSQFGILFICLNMINPKNVFGVLPFELAMIFIVAAIFGLVADAILFKTMKDSIENEKLKKSLQIFEIQSQYYSIVREQQKEIRELQHDIANHLAVTKQLNGMREEDYINELRRKNPTIKLEYCMNSVINAMVVLFDISCKEKEIKTEWHFSPLSEIGVEDFDLVSICTNVLDNAMEAVLALPKEQRYISFSIAENKNLILISCQNSYEKGKKHYLNSDKLTHGNGNEIILETAKKYGGTVERKPEDKYLVNIVLFEKTK